MITVSNTYTVDNYVSTSAPYTYTFTFSNANVTADSLSGTVGTDGKISIVASFPTEADFTSFTASLVITDVHGCSSTIDISSDFVNPCTGIVVSDISRSGLDFSVTTTASSTLEWYYDEDSFDGETVGNSLRLTVKAGAVIIDGQQSSVSVKLTSDKGCETEKSISFTFETPSAPLIQETSICLENNPINSDLIDIASSVSHTFPIDWSTLVVTPLSSQVTVNDQGQGKITLSKEANTSSATHTVNYVVKDIYGVQSNTGVIVWSITCNSGSSTEPAGTLNSDNMLTVADGEKILLPLTVGDGTAFEHTQFVGIQAKGQDIDSTGRILTTANGQATFVNDATVGEAVQFQLTTGSPTGEGEIIQVQFYNDVLEKSKIVQGVVTFDVIDGPDFSVVHEIAALTTEWSPWVDLKPYVTGDYDEKSFEFGTVFSNGDANLTDDGLIQFRPSSGYFSNQVQQCTVIVKNKNGVSSDPQPIYMSIDQKPVLSSSSDNITCKASPFNLKSYLSVTSSFGTGGEWTETSASGVTYTSQGGSIVDPNDLGTVDFTSIIDGEYQFTYTVSRATLGGTLGGKPVQEHNNPAEEAVVLTIIKNSTPSISIDSTPLVDTGQYRINFTVISGTGVSGLTVTVDSAAPTYVTPPSISGTTGTMVLSLSTGSRTVGLQMTTVCDTTVSDSTVIVVP